MRLHREEIVIEQECPDFAAGCEFLVAVDRFKPVAIGTLICGATDVCPLMEQLKEDRTSEE
jgi:hypothetical protein